MVCFDPRGMKGRSLWFARYLVFSFGACVPGLFFNTFHAKADLPLHLLMLDLIEVATLPPKSALPPKNCVAGSKVWNVYFCFFYGASMVRCILVTYWSRLHLFPLLTVTKWRWRLQFATSTTPSRRRRLPTRRRHQPPTVKCHSLKIRDPNPPRYPLKFTIWLMSTMEVNYYFSYIFSRVADI